MDQLGALNQRIDIYNVGQTKDATYGGASFSPTLFKTLWAGVAYSSAGTGDDVSASQKAGVSKVAFTIHYRTDLNTTMVVKYNDQLFSITGILHDANRQFTTIETTQPGAAWDKQILA